MAELKNTEILGRIIKSTIGVIGRRTSEAYANVVVENSLKKISSKYSFLENVKIEKDRFKEVINVIEINDKIDDLDIKLVGTAIRDFMITIANTMGKDAGFYFIKEIKEDLPYSYENKIKDLGVDLDYIQSEFITEVKSTFKFSIDNSDLLKYMFSLIYEILEQELGRKKAYSLLNEFVGLFSTKYELLSYIKINDVVSIQNVDIVSVDKNVNNINSDKIGSVLQKIIQEINKELNGYNIVTFVNKIDSKLSADYRFKLKEIGVNFDVIKLKKTLLVKNVLKVLIEILTESSTESYAVLIINNILEKKKERFLFLKYIKIDSVKISEGADSIVVSDEIDSVSPSELGRFLQRVMEKVSTSLGDDAGKYFIDKFKDRIGKPYLLRMEEIGVNLHMIELRKNLLW